MSRRLGSIRSARALPGGPLDPPDEPPFEELPHWADGVCDRCLDPMSGVQDLCPSCRITAAGEAAEQAAAAAEAAEQAEQAARMAAEVPSRAVSRLEAVVMTSVALGGPSIETMQAAADALRGEPS